MAPHKEVGSLRSLCLKTFGKWLVSLCDDGLSSGMAKFDVQLLRSLLYDDTPETLHCDLGICCMTVLNDWYDSIEESDSDRLSKAETVVGQLADLIPNSKITNFIVKRYSLFYLCKPVSQAIVRNLGQLSGLEEFDSCEFHDDVEPTSMQNHLANNLGSLTNLRRFKYYQGQCNDEMIKTLCQNCPEIREIAVNPSKEVTDDCIDSLLLCAKLETLCLSGTSVTKAGYARLIQEKESLKELPCRIIMEVLAILNESCKSRTFGLRDLDYDFNRNEDLQAVAERFPFLSHVSVCGDDPNIFNNITLNLENISIRVPRLSKIFNSLVNYLSFKGSSVTHLRLCSRRVIMPQKTVKITALCSNLESFAIQTSGTYSVDSFDDLQTWSPTLYNLIQARNPFERLKKIEVRCNQTLVQHAKNVETLSLWFLPLLDEFFSKLFEFNQLEHVKHLMLFWNKALSANTLKTLIVKCKNLEVIQYHCGDTRDEGKAIVKEVKAFIAMNNYAVDFEIDV